MAHSVKPITKVKLGREGGLMTPTEVAELARSTVGRGEVSLTSESEGSKFLAT